MMVQTVTGPIPVESLGRTLMHEHLFIAFPGSWFDPLARFDRAELIEEAVRRLVTLRAECGVRTFVDPCPIELGRDATMIKEISEKSGMQIICTTGFYYEKMGLPIYWRRRTVDEIADLYIREITHGIGHTGVKAGAFKVSTGAPVATEEEKKFLAAACIAHKATGMPIITHTTEGCAGPEQQQLFEIGGVPAHRCLIGHCCTNPDVAYHRRIVEGGSYIGFDQIGMENVQRDDVRANNVAQLVRDGFCAQIIMSMDRLCGYLGKPTARQPTPEEMAKIEYLKSRGLWQSHTYIFTDFIPMLRARGVSQTDIVSILEDNPRRFFAGEVVPEEAARASMSRQAR
ncbi:phosphotriesterase family protein [Bradyrhizobium vignae]|uniref:Putative metal-dependent hydrolase with the TIM-barrel fold n=1 Tax=Bradyrhizobium vignae TaxID=1549949 RepID=A0A2U3Q9J9_9BRAD|nr:phosphotriesterase-related protein [Bradyrhizobium vignae]SPP98068.1 putative metal-dependent hydrolase with the TIM-barrel fold [Bradyrhizobium vignae]